MIKTRILPALLAAALATPALGAGGAGKMTDVDFSFEGPFGAYDAMQLQREMEEDMAEYMRMARAAPTRRAALPRLWLLASAG